MHPRVAIEVKKHFKPADGNVSKDGGAKKYCCRACKKVLTGSATKLSRSGTCSKIPDLLDLRSGTSEPGPAGPGPDHTGP